VRGRVAEGLGEELGEGFGFTGGALVFVGVVVLLGVAVVLVVVLCAVVVRDVVGAPAGVAPVPVHAPSTRQAAANQTVCRMVTEGSPTPRRAAVAETSRSAQVWPGADSGLTGGRLGADSGLTRG
jgi:hypothetical protein